MKNSLRKNGDFFEDNFPLGKEKELGLLVADHVSAMIAYWDRNEICRFANNAYMKWYGKTHGDINDTTTMKEFLGPLYEKNVPYLKEVIKGKTQIFEQEIQSNFGNLNHSITTYTADKVSGVVRGFFVHITDITDTKMKEQELIRNNEIISDQNNRLTNYTYLMSYTLKSKSASFKRALNSFIEAGTEKEKAEMLGFLYNISSKFSETVNNFNEYASIQSRVNIELDRKLLVKVPKPMAKMPHQLTDFKKNRPNRGV